jgi:hypothetical protein
MRGFMTDRPNYAAKARAETVFDLPGAETKSPSATDEYKARQDAERAKMARLKAQRLAAETKAGVKAKAKR